MNENVNRGRAMDYLFQSFFLRNEQEDDSKDEDQPIVDLNHSQPATLLNFHEQLHQYSSLELFL